MYRETRAKTMKKNFAKIYDGLELDVGSSKCNRVFKIYECSFITWILALLTDELCT